MTAEPKRALGGSVVRLARVIAVGAFLALLVYGVLAKAPDRTIDDRLAQGQAAAAPGFELAAFADGEPGDRLERAWQQAAADGKVDLAELRGTPIVLNFWASWCDPCRVEAPLLREGHQRWRKRGVLFLGLNMQDIREDAREFLDEFNLEFPQVRDPTNQTARRWGVTGIPETFFITSRGDVVGHVIGTVTAQQLAAGAAAAKAGRPLSATRGGEQRPTR